MKPILRGLTVLALVILSGWLIAPTVYAATSTPTPHPAATPTPTPSRPAATPALTETPRPTLTPTPLRPTATPAPTETPRPTPTPTKPEPFTEKSGYTLVTSLSADPKSHDYTASFSPDVSAIYAWALIVAEGGTVEKQFAVDIQFTSPLGSKVDSRWYSSDTGKVTTVSRESYDAGRWGSKNVARRQLDMAGTDNADLTGQWTVTFSVSGKVVHTENFTLATTAELDAWQELEDKGYTVNNFGTTTWSDGTVVAYVRMPMISKTIYSSETSQQLVDGFTADRKGFPNATVLIVQLEYTKRYWIRYDIKVADWDAYVKTKNFDKFVAALYYSVWDTEKQDWVPKAELKDFMKKNFGAGTYKPPPSVDPKKGTVGSVRVQVSPSTLLADGTSTAQVTATVYDKQNKALPNTTLAFAVSGTGMGTIQPKTATTDSKGQAKATYKAGTKAGTVTLIVTAGSTTGTTTLTLGEEPTEDPAADNVRTYLAGQGYKVLMVEYSQAKSYAYVVLDLGEDFDIYDLTWAVIHGCTTLRDNYPDALTLAAAVLYEHEYVLIFPAKATDVDRLVAAVKAARGDKTKINAALQRFLDIVFNNAVVMDARTGKVIGTVKDFTSITFGF